MDLSLRTFEAERAALLEVTERLTAHQQVAVCTGAWSPREVILHLVGWDVFYIGSILNTFAGNPIEPIPASEKINPQSLARYAKLSWAEAVELFRKSSAELADVYGSISLHARFNPIWREPVVRTPGNVLLMQASHYAHHREQLARLGELEGQHRVPLGA